MTERPIKRGDIYIADLDPVRGHEQGKERRVLVVSNDIGNSIGGIVTVLPISGEYSSRDKQYPMNIPIHPTPQNGQTKSSYILSTQIRVLSVKERLRDYVGSVDKSVMMKVDKALELSLALTRCYVCDFVLMPNAKKCINKKCNAMLVEICNSCHSQVDTRHTYCPNCGNKRGGE